jgi:hypothetical protein
VPEADSRLERNSTPDIFSANPLSGQHRSYRFCEICAVSFNERHTTALLAFSSPG